MRSRATTQRRRFPVLPAVVAAAAIAVTATSDRTVRRANHAPAAAARGQASTYFVDPDTGAPREPTPDELLALQSQRLQAAEASQPQPITTDSGFTGLRLSDDQMMFTVATRRADGTVTISHAAGKKEAERQVKQLSERGLTAGKEQPLER